MRAGLLQRQAALAGVALVAALAALALGRSGDADGRPAQPATSPGAEAGTWYEAIASSYGPGFYGRPTACGVGLTPQTKGVAHPVLPCGARLVVSFGGRQVPTEVIDKGPYVAGREFSLTEALSNDLGLEGIQTIRWRFAG